MKNVILAAAMAALIAGCGSSSPQFGPGACITGYTPSPAITNISPSSGAVAGGTVVALTGTGFEGCAVNGATITVNGTRATIKWQNDTTIVFVAPPEPAGTYTVVETSNFEGASATATTTFTYS